MKIVGRVLRLKEYSVLEIMLENKKLFFQTMFFSTVFKKNMFFLKRTCFFFPENTNQKYMQAQ